MFTHILFTCLKTHKEECPATLDLACMNSLWKQSSSSIILEFEVAYFQMKSLNSQLNCF